ncbi:MAG: hypothetical protein HUJ31_10665 [Pseudomonadales bacterium]|nr:hypothetical protein [Pseudomonadales bacterium]
MPDTEAIYCEATLNYSDEMRERIPVTMPIYDGRDALDGLDFESCGFTLLKHRSKVNDWRDIEHLRAVHSPEIETLTMELTGCDHAIVYGPLVRSPKAAQEIADYAPIEFVHSDFTEDYGLMVREPDRPYRKFLDPLLAEKGLTREDVAGARRILLMQYWRNIGAINPDYPLAFCDAASVPESQLYRFLVPEYGGERLEFQTFGVNPPADTEDHRWFTFPSMTAEEVVAFRTYDSLCEQEGRPFWTPHSAFRDPTAGARAPERESLEMRVLCLFD